MNQLPSPLSILSIEDSDNDFALIERALRQGDLDYRVHRVDSNQGLKKAMTEDRFDLVLSDYSVPGMYFTDVLGYFLRHWPELPVILVSGTLGDVKAAAMVKLGARAFVSKDRLSELVPTIREVLNAPALPRSD